LVRGDQINHRRKDYRIMPHHRKRKRFVVCEEPFPDAMAAASKGPANVTGRSIAAMIVR
jgi:hypothetical protein